MLREKDCSQAAAAFCLVCLSLMKYFIVSCKTHLCFVAILGHMTHEWTF